MQYQPDDIPRLFLEKFPEFEQDYKLFREQLDNEDGFKYINAGEIAGYFLDMIFDGHQRINDAVELIERICENGSKEVLDIMQIGFFEDMHLILWHKWESQGVYLEKKQQLMNVLTESLRKRYNNAEEYFGRFGNSSL